MLNDVLRGQKVNDSLSIHWNLHFSDTHSAWGRLGESSQYRFAPDFPWAQGGKIEIGNLRLCKNSSVCDF